MLQNPEECDASGKDSAAAGSSTRQERSLRPIIDTEEKRRIQAGKCLALYRTATVESAMVSISDDFLVTPSGPIPLDDSFAKDDEIAIVG